MTEVELAAAALAAGRLVAFPTETVYGLGASARNEQAVARVFAAKGRPPGRALTVHLGDAAGAQQWGQMGDGAKALAEAFWPGPLTLVVPRVPGVADIVTGGQDTVGLRVPDHPLALQLLLAFGDGVAAPSANPFGAPSPTTAQHVREGLGDAVDVILDGGPCRLGLESTVVSLVGAPRVLRRGAIATAAMEMILGCAIAAPAADQATTAASVRLVDADGVRASRGPVLSWTRPPAGVLWHNAATDPTAYARELYDALHRLGEGPVDVERPPNTADWQAIVDRLQRLAGDG